MLYEFGDFNLKETYAPVWQREGRSGFALGSAGCFLVLESREHAEARGAKPYARLTKVVADLAQRKQPGAVTEIAGSAVAEARGVAGDSGNLITGATGAEPVTSEEKAFLRQHPGFAVRATGTMFGHTLETQFPLGLALAALSISRGALFPPNDPTGLEVEKPDAAGPDCGGGGRSLAGRRHGPGRGHQVERWHPSALPRPDQTMD